LLLHSAGDGIVAKGLCDFLDNNGYVTITASESTSEDFSIDISNEDDLQATAQVLHRTLVLYSDRTSPVFRKAVEQILAVDDLHPKTHILIFNTYATELQIPNVVNRRFTDRKMMTTRVEELLDGVGGKFMYSKQIDYMVRCYNFFVFTCFILFIWHCVSVQHTNHIMNNCFHLKAVVRKILVKMAPFQICNIHRLAYFHGTVELSRSL